VPKIILIVEDCADIRMMMRIILHTYGYETIEAADGYEAIEQAREKILDLILMDISMPVMDGLCATQVIRTLDGYDKVPIIAVTAYDKAYHSRAIAAGCNKVLGKPLDFDSLEPLLSGYLT
jgi:CheY-like chemotaxis protein